MSVTKASPEKAPTRVRCSSPNQRADGGSTWADRAVLLDDAQPLDLFQGIADLEVNLHTGAPLKLDLDVIIQLRAGPAALAAVAPQEEVRKKCFTALLFLRRLVLSSGAIGTECIELRSQTPRSHKAVAMQMPEHRRHMHVARLRLLRPPF